MSYNYSKKRNNQNENFSYITFKNISEHTKYTSTVTDSQFILQQAKKRHEMRKYHYNTEVLPDAIDCYGFLLEEVF